MKYIKTFENERQEKYKLFRKKGICKELTFVIFKFKILDLNTYKGVWHLILGQIVNNSFSSHYSRIYIIDNISDGPSQIKENNVEQPFPMEKFNEIVYTSDSIVDAKNKFDELKEIEPYKTWKFNQDITKYNL